MAYPKNLANGLSMPSPSEPAPSPLLFVNVRPVLPVILQLLFAPLVAMSTNATRWQAVLQNEMASWWRLTKQLYAVSALASRPVPRRSSN
jgi:hypothetical protein